MLEVPRIKRSKSLPIVFDHTKSIKEDIKEDIKECFQSRRTVSAVVYENPEKLGGSSSVFNFWENEFIENVVLVSNSGFPKDEYNGRLAVIGDVPCYIKQVDTVPSGCLSIPPFFKLPEVNAGAKVSFCFAKKDEINAESADVTIVKCFPDLNLELYDYVVIDKEELKKKLKKSSIKFPIIDSQEYCCKIKVAFVKENISVYRDDINLVFKVSNIKPECNENSIILFNEETRLLTLKSDLDKIKIFSSNEPQPLSIYCTCHAVTELSNEVTLTHTMYNKLNLCNFSRSVISVNGMAFLIRGTNNDHASALKEGVLHLSQTSFLSLKKGGTGFGNGDIRLFPNSLFPDAATVELNIGWLANGHVELDDLADAGRLEKLVRKGLRAVPLQKGRICQVAVGEETGIQKQVKVTIAQVSGNSDSQSKKEEQPSAEVYWMSDNTAIKIAERPQYPKVKSTFFDVDESEPLVKQLLENMGGIKEIAEKMVREIITPMILFSEEKINKPPHTGIILYGPTGTGKTILAKALAGILAKCSRICRGRDGIIKLVQGPELFNKFIGESEAAVRKLFQDVDSEFQSYGSKAPLHIIIIDEMDSILPERVEKKHDSTMTRNLVVNQFLSCMSNSGTWGNMVFIGTTNRFEFIDEAAKRPGRFGLHYNIDNPDLSARKEILKLYAGKSKLPVNLEDDEYLKIARKTEGKSGAFLEELFKQADMTALLNGACIENLSIEKIRGLASEKAEIDCALLIEAFDKIKLIPKVENALAAYLPNEDVFYKLECQGYMANQSQACPERVVSYMKRVFQSSAGSGGVILIEGGKLSGKSYMVRHLVKESGAGHLLVIKVDDLIDNANAVGYIDEQMNKAQIHDRKIVIVDRYDLLFDESVRFKTSRNLLANKIGNQLKITNTRRVCILTSRPMPVSYHAFANFTINKKIKLKNLTRTDMTQILQNMNTTEHDIKKVLSIIPQEISVGNFINIVSPCVTLTPSDKVARWELEALKQDVQDFTENSEQEYSMYA